MSRAAALVLVLAAAFALRRTTLDAPHFDSDEPAWEALATMLIASGGRAYTARHVGLDVVGVDSAGVALVRLRPDRRSHSDVLDFYAPEHQDAVDDRATSLRAPLFAVALAASTRLAGERAVATMALVSSGARTARLREEQFRAAVRQERPAWRRAQLPTVLPSLGFSLAAVALVVAATRGPWGAVAGLALATAPLEVWSAHRVTADTLTEVATGGAALLLARAVARDGRAGIAWAFAAGAATGLAVLAKASGLVVLPAAALTEALLLVRARARGDEARPGAAAARLGAVACGTLMTGLWWPLSRYLATGDPVEALGSGGVALPPEAMAGSWLRYVHGRPPWTAAATTAVLSPLLALGGVALVAQAIAFLRARGADAGAVALAAVACGCVAATLLWPARENRYLLTAYVPLALGAGDLARGTFARARGAGARGGVVVLLLAVLAYQTWGALRDGPSGRYELSPIGPAPPG